MIPRTKLYYKDAMGDRVIITDIEGCMSISQLRSLDVPQEFIDEYLSDAPMYYRTERSKFVYVHGPSHSVALQLNKPIDKDEFGWAVRTMKAAGERLSCLLGHDERSKPNIIEI